MTWSKPVASWILLIVVVTVASEATAAQAEQTDTDHTDSSAIAVATRELANESTSHLHSDAVLPGAINQVSYCEPLSNRAAPGKASYPTVRITGFFQADAGWFHQDDANIVAVGNIQDGADFRRARLAAVGSVADNVAYNIEFDFAFPVRTAFMDVWLELQNLSLLQNIRVGQYRNPFGLDGLTSVKDLTFIERGLPFAFLPFRQIGAMTYGHSRDEDFTWAVSAFRFPTDPLGGQLGDNGGYGLATRLTGLLIDQNQCSLHVGGAYSVIDPANDAVRYRSQPEFFIAETGGAAFVPAGVPTAVPPFVDTDVIATDHTNLFSVEFASTSGPVHGQVEAIYAMVNRPADPSVAFNGISAQAAWIVTGEHRPYNRQGGVLGRIVPKCDCGDGGIGAWEVAARYSYLDLNDSDIRGGRLNDWTLGLNWYLNRYTKFQFNYIRALLSSPVNGDSAAGILATRAQIDF